MAEPGSRLSGSAFRTLIVVLLLPVVLTVCWLTAESTGALPTWLHDAAMDIPWPPTTVGAGFGLLGTSYLLKEPRMRPVGPLLLCSTAPLALLFPWAVAAGPVPGAYAGMPYFLGWLTRYPNFGPVNIEVLAGTAAMLATGFLPAAVALLLLMAAPRRVVLGTLALVMVAYVPVLLRLDIELALVTERLRDETDFPPFPYFGPMLRAAAMAALLILVFGRPGLPVRTVTRPPPGSHPGRR